MSFLTSYKVSVLTLRWGFPETKNQGAAENVFEFTRDRRPRQDCQDANVSETDKVLRKRGRSSG